MAQIDTALAGSQNATRQMIATAEASGSAWSVPPAPGKWSPSQIVEHVARSLEESAHVAGGRPSKFPKIPSILHPVIRGMLFKRVLKNGAFPKARTNKAMNPASGPATPAEGRSRLEGAQARFDAACRELAARGGMMRTTTFGSVTVEDYVRFMEIHTRHHDKQMVARQHVASA